MAAKRNPAFLPRPSELCQLALDWERRRPMPSPDWLLEEKHDGIRLLWRDAELTTREGEPFPAAEHLRPIFQRLEARAGWPMFFDCEFTVEGGFLATLAAFRRGEPGEGRAMLFDGFPLSQWREGASVLTQEGRRAVLKTIFDDYRPDGVHLVSQVPAPWAPANVLLAAQAVWKRGGEGLMVKNRHERYNRTRNGAWLKLKRSLKLVATVLEVLNDGAAVRLDYQGHKVRVAVPPHLRDQAPPSVANSAVVVAMEWTEKGSLRQGRVESFSDGGV
jgi:ATP-dependent DNA ligase